MLLQWCILEPSGPSRLAALRFASPVRIKSISIFPTDDRPFKESPDVVSRTEPEAFFLEVYFNAHPISSPNSKEKPKTTNALMPTLIAYAGGRMDFFVNMSSEVATRFMVVKGSFESVSMAIYGDVVSELPPLPSTYEPKPIPVLDPIPLSNSLDASTFRDPTQLAAKLLQLIPDAPPLPLVIRLMFCLKPENEDWDQPDFPYLYANLEDLAEDCTVKEAFELTSRPVDDETSLDAFRAFAQKTAQVTDAREDSPYYFACVLSHAACQHPDMARTLLEEVDLSRIFDMLNMEKDVLQRFYDSIANIEIAKALNNPWFVDLLSSIVKNAGLPNDRRVLARRILDRLEGIAILEDAISNTQGDFITSARVLKDIITSERSLGIWLETMVTHQDLLERLNENPPSSAPLHNFPQLFNPGKSSVSHEEFITFLRALIGVSCVFAVYAWADSLPHPHCRQRVLSILRLWQGVEGYTEIVNHLLLLRQMIYRLECMLEMDAPDKSGIDAEQLLVNLAKNPHSFLSPDLTRCILDMNPPHCSITYDERVSMCKAADIADYGLSGALEHLLQPLQHPSTFDSIRALRVALAIVNSGLVEDSEHNILQESWEKGNCSLETCLVNIFVHLSDEISSHFAAQSSLSCPTDLLAQLFRASDQAVGVLLHLLQHYPLMGRLTRAVVTSVTNLFVCTDVVDSLYAQTSPTCAAAQQTRTSCVDVVRSLANAPAEARGSKSNAEVVLRTLLQHGLQPGNHDPARHLIQVFCLIDYLLPFPNESAPINWTQTVFPGILAELWTFCRALDPENKAHFVRRLVALDKDVIGVGDWLLQQELRELLQTLKTFDDPNTPTQHWLIRQYQVSLSLRFLTDLLSSTSGEAEWCTRSLTTDPETAQIVATLLDRLAEHNVVSEHLRKVVDTLANHDHNDDALKIPLALALIRISHIGALSTSTITTSLYLAHSLLLAAPSYVLRSDSISYEITSLLLKLVTSSQLAEGGVAEALLGILEWLGTVDDPSARTLGVTEIVFDAVGAKMTSCLPQDKTGVLDTVKTRLHFSEFEQSERGTIVLPDTLELSVQDIEDLLHPPSLVPSTPPRRVLNQDVLSLVAISPPTAVIRSPAATGLTKTYSNNDFRQLRQTPSARQNTSRLPSMHVDDFENATSSPTLLPLPMSVPIPLPTAGPSAIPFAATAPGATETFVASLSPVFKLL